MTHEEREYEAGRNAANDEIKFDNWTRETARRYLANVGRAISPFSRGYDDAIRAYAEAGQ